MKYLKKRLKLITLIVLSMAAFGLFVSGCSTDGAADPSPDPEPPVSPKPPEQQTNPPGTEEPAGQNPAENGKPDISYMTSLELTHTMAAGWNLGNTLDAHWNARAWGTIEVPGDQETLWGNPVTTKEMIDFIKASGFNTIRIPVTWYIFTGPGPEYMIDDIWMDRVQEVVDYVIDNGMFAILNIHHDDYRSGGNWECGWLRLYGDGAPLDEDEKSYMRDRFGRLWTQIAERFKDYDEYLIFDAINEPHTSNLHRHNAETWEGQSVFLNELLQIFIDTVRAGGGRNPDRHLMVAPYYASVGMEPNDRDGRIGHFVDKENAKLRIDDPRGRLIVSLHYYEPWGFVTAPEDSQWFSWYFDLEVGSVSHNLRVLLQIIEENFTSLGIPVVMGETGALHRTMPEGGSNEAERIKWAEYYITRLRELGVPTVIWDDGGQFRLLDRVNLEWVWKDFVTAFVEAAKPAG